MITKQPKQTLSTIALVLFSAIAIVSCNNSADTSKMGTDSTKMDTASKMSAPAADTTMKKDTMKMDTAAKRPIKVAS